MAVQGIPRTRRGQQGEGDREGGQGKISVRFEVSAVGSGGPLCLLEKGEAAAFTHRVPGPLEMELTGKGSRTSGLRSPTRVKQSMATLEKAPGKLRDGGREVDSTRWH